MLMEIEVNDTGIARAVALAGSQHKMAAALGVTQQAVMQWVRQGYVPVLRAVEIEHQFGVNRQELVHPRLARVFDATTVDAGE